MQGGRRCRRRLNGCRSVRTPTLRWAVVRGSQHETFLPWLRMNSSPGGCSGPVSGIGMTIPFCVSQTVAAGPRSATGCDAIPQARRYRPAPAQRDAGGRSVRRGGSTPGSRTGRRDGDGRREPGRARPSSCGPQASSRRAAARRSVRDGPLRALQLLPMWEKHRLRRR